MPSPIFRPHLAHWNIIDMNLNKYRNNVEHKIYSRAYANSDQQIFDDLPGMNGKIGGNIQKQISLTEYNRRVLKQNVLDF